jgi:predicted amidophosphoribosyltransferase
VVWRDVLDLLFPPQCASCNAFGAGLCAACVPERSPINIRLPTLSVTAFGAYEGNLRAAILALKDGRRDVAETLGQMVASLVEPGSLLVPIPTTAKRRRVRGLDGVALVARCAAALRGASVVAALEQRSGDAQHGRSRKQRLAACGRFGCNPANVAARRITLFDDVCTTGSTLRDSADAVREAGGLVEDAVVVAVTKSHQPWRVPIVN